MQQVSTQLRESEFILHLVKPIQIETMQIEMIFAKKYVIHVLSRPDAAKLCRSKCKERVLDADTESLRIQMQVNAIFNRFISSQYFDDQVFLRNLWHLK